MDESLPQKIEEEKTFVKGKVTAENMRGTGCKKYLTLLYKII
jgi:hypothetical protein